MQKPRIKNLFIFFSLSLRYIYISRTIKYFQSQKTAKFYVFIFLQIA